MNPIFKDKTILITGGTGSFGKAFVRWLLLNEKFRKIIIYSRDEWKQSQMQNELGDPLSLRWFIGDVRDKERLSRAMHKVDFVVHAAALKQIPVCEYNPFEAVKTNIVGASNIVDVAIDSGVKKVVNLSTDKAVNPINLYGATKLCAEKVMIQGNTYAAAQNTRFSCVRYGNVVGSRGSVIPLFLKEKDSGILPITDKRMTRFWMTLTESVQLVIQSLLIMNGGEIFVSKIPSMKIIDLAHAVAPAAALKEIGIRPGEKLHEILITRDEAPYTWEYQDRFVIEPLYMWWGDKQIKKGKKVSEDFTYQSNTNKNWLTAKQILKILKDEKFI